MNFYIKGIFFSFFFVLAAFKLNAEDNFCLDKEGLIYPLFESIECNEKTDEKINKKEFSYVIDFESDKRISRLEEYRKNSENIEKEKEKKLTEAIEETKDDTNINKRKKELEQKKIAKLAKEQKLAQERNLKKEQRKKELEKRKLELKKKRLAKKKEQQKKREELKNKRLAKKKEQQKKREELEKKRLAKKIESEKKRKLRKEQQEKKRLTRKKEIDEEKESIIADTEINNNLKIVYLAKKIVKNEFLPNINPTSSLDFSKIEALEKNNIKSILKKNNNLILIIPEDYETAANVVSENQKTSKLVAGSREVPNPEFNRLQMEMRRAERELRRAQAEAERGFQMSQCYSCGLITQWGGVALQSKWQKQAKSLQYQITNLTNQYASTSEYLTKELLRNYEFVVQNVKAEKKARYKIIESKNEKFYEKQLDILETKDFKVAYNIDPQDKNYDSLINQYNNADDLTRWQNQKIANLSSQSLYDKINLIKNPREISGKNELYASLDIEYKKKKKSVFGNLFSFGSKKNKRKKSSSLSKSSYELKDERFKSVVIIRTESGLGSGFFISKDEILTNYHVVEGSMSISIIDKNKKKSSAILIKKDLKRDLALLKTNMKGSPVSFFSGQLKQGEMVEALGHPKGRKFSLTKGWISAVREESSIYNASENPNVLYIQTDAAINSGNSGGPLFYKNKVVGVNTQKLAGKSIEGMNFAVHFSEVQKFLSQ